MKQRRLDRVAEEIRREISAILVQDVKDPRLTMVSVTRIEVSNDLGSVRVLVSVLGDELKQEQAMQALEKARGFVRSELSNRVRLRHAPEISFRLDKSIEHGIRISTIIDELSINGSGHGENG